MFQHVLIPMDGSTCADKALDLGLRLAKDQSAKLTLCYVCDSVRAATMLGIESGTWIRAARDGAKATLDEAEQRAASSGQAVRKRVVEGLPVDAIVGVAEEVGADLIVMGSHGRSGLARVLLGSVAEGVLRTASVPVMIAKESDRAPE